MREKIEIGYKELSNGFMHSFLLYTDKNGKQWFERGGPNESEKEHSPINDLIGLRNRYKIDSGEYIAGTADHPGFDLDINNGIIKKVEKPPYPTKTVLEGEDLSSYWDGIIKSADKYKNGEYRYDFLRQNCHTLIGTILRENNITLPNSDYLTPGIDSNMSLDWSNTVNDFATLQNYIATINHFFNPTMTDIDRDYYSSVTLSQFLKDFLDFINPYSSFYISPTIYDPITLDLNKDGKINTTGLDKGVYFDHSSDKVAMKTSWVGKEDGLLVHDRNSNGIIDDGSELFGNFTPLNPNNNPSKRNLAVNGYHALKSYDMNSDGIIDDNDEIYKYLKVWQDINSDGISQADELKTLEQASIKSLNLAFENIDKDLDNGNNLMFEGNYTDNEGKEHKMADINFNVDTVSSKHKDDITLNQEQANQINLQGSGNLRDLNQAAVLSSTLNDILNNYKYANTKEEQLNLLPNLINEWAKTSVGYTEYKHSLSSVTYFDESTPQGKLAVLRQRYAQATSETQKIVIHQEMVNIENKLAETNYQQALKEANQDEELRHIMQQSGNKLPSVYTPKNRTTQLRPSELNSLKQGLQDQSLLKSFDEIKYKIGIIDAFTVKQTGRLYYAEDNDVKDIIQKVNKTYDNILEYAYNALLPQTRLKEYISLMDVKVLETKDKNANIKYNFSLDYSKVADKFKEVIKENPIKAFSDIGEFLFAVKTDSGNKNIMPIIEVFGDMIKYASKNNTLDEWGNALKTYSGSVNIIKTGKEGGTTNASKQDDVVYGDKGNDIIWGNEGDDILYGGAGNDNLIGNLGDDILEGGEGDDTFQGREGNDTYIIGKGDGNDTVYADGNDTIKFKEGITKDDLIFRRASFWGADLLINFKSSNGSVTVKDMFYRNNDDNSKGINKVEFADGSLLNLKDIKAMVLESIESQSNLIYGFDSNDTIKGGPKNDLIYGHKGDDILYGGAGDDTLQGGEGKDVLYGNDGNDIIWGNEGDDILYGGAGNDNLIGNLGDDILEGGEGDDTFQGREGNDTYIIGKGDGNDTVYADGNDTIKFKEGITKENLTFMFNGNNLSIRYGDKDSITVNNYTGNAAYQIEKIELEGGNFITNSQINKIIQDINAYAKDNGITAISHDTIRSNQDMMNLVMSGWNS